MVPHAPFAHSPYSYHHGHSSFVLGAEDTAGRHVPQGTHSVMGMPLVFSWQFGSATFSVDRSRFCWLALYCIEYSRFVHFAPNDAHWPPSPLQQQVPKDWRWCSCPGLLTGNTWVNWAAGPRGTWSVGSGEVISVKRKFHNLADFTIWEWKSWCYKCAVLFIF